MAPTGHEESETNTDRTSPAMAPTGLVQRLQTLLGTVFDRVTISSLVLLISTRAGRQMWPAQLSEKIQNWKILFSEKPNVQKIMLSEKSRIWKLSFQKNQVFRKILLSENLVSAVYVRFTRADWHRNNHPVVRYRYGIAARVIIAYRDTTRFIILLFMDNSGDKRNRLQFPI